MLRRCLTGLGSIVNTMIRENQYDCLKTTWISTIVASLSSQIWANSTQENTSFKLRKQTSSLG